MLAILSIKTFKELEQFKKDCNIKAFGYNIKGHNLIVFKRN